MNRRRLKTTRIVAKSIHERAHRRRPAPRRFTTIAARCGMRRSRTASGGDVGDTPISQPHARPLRCPGCPATPGRPQVMARSFRTRAWPPACQSGITRVSSDGGMTCGLGEVPNFLVERHSRQKLCTLFFGGSAQVYRATRSGLTISARFSSLQPVISQPL